MQNETAKMNGNQLAFMKRFDQCISLFENFFVFISAVLLIIMLFIISYGALGRYLFNIPTAWTVEVSEYIMVAIGFLSVPWILKHDGHVQVDILLNAVDQRKRRILNILTMGIAMICCILLFWFSLFAVIDHYQRNVMMLHILQIPKYAVLIPIPLGSLFLSLRFLYKCLHLIRER